MQTFHYILLTAGVLLIGFLIVAPSLSEETITIEECVDQMTETVDPVK